MIPPSGRVPKQGHNWFFVATESCGGGTPDLGYFLKVWGFIGEVGVENKSGWSLSHARGRRRAGRRARPPPSWAPRGSPNRLLSPIYVHIP